MLKTKIDQRYRVIIADPFTFNSLEDCITVRDVFCKKLGFCYVWKFEQEIALIFVIHAAVLRIISVDELTPALLFLLLLAYLGI